MNVLGLRKEQKNKTAQHYRNIEIWEYSSSTLYRNNRNNAFADVSDQMGLDETILTMGPNSGDADNDGFLDMYLGNGVRSYTTIFPNKLFKNNAATSFSDVTTSGEVLAILKKVIA